MAVIVIMTNVTHVIQSNKKKEDAFLRGIVTGGLKRSSTGRGSYQPPLPCEILSIDRGNYRDGSEAATIRSKAAANAVNCDGLRNCRREGYPPRVQRTLFIHACQSA